MPPLEISIAHDGAELARYQIAAGEYTIGRAPGCSVLIEIGPVSRQHARLLVGETGSVEVEDLGSHNGTFLDEAPIAGLTAWQAGQLLRVGDAMLRLGPATDGYAPVLSPSRSDTDPAPELTEDELIRRHLPLTERRAQRLEIGPEIARGGMGAVLEARESATRRTVAMKVMLGANDPKGTLRFIEEAQVTAQLEHPNIVPVHDLGLDAQGQPFYTMKLVEGITLKKVIELLQQRIPATVEKYPLAALLTTFQKVCDALAFAHSRGVIHRDLKPANIMLGKFGEVMVMDWGLAKVVGGSSQRRAEGGAELESPFRMITARTSGLDTVAGAPTPSDGYATLAGSVMGTVHYMSPEQARGEVATLDARSDVFTLGVILYELLTLQRPFAGRNAAEILGKIVASEFVPPAERVRQLPKAERPAHLPGGEVPASLDALIRQTLAHDRAQRYPGVTALQDDLTAYQNGFATIAERAGAWTQLKLFVARNRAVATSIAAALLVLAAVAAGFTAKVVSERNRAEWALGNLLKTAPTLIAEGRKSIDAQQFDEALVKISFAVEIEPQNASHRLLRAHLLQAMLRLDEAAAEFRRVLALAPDDNAKGSAQANLAMCEKLLAEYPDPANFDRVAWQQLYERMEKEGRSTQAAPMAVKLGRAKDAANAVLTARLVEWRKLPGWEKKPEQFRVMWESDGTLNLDLESVLIDDLSSVAALPVSKLVINHTRVSDLNPLQGMRLRTLWASNLPQLADLSPLKGMPMESFACRGSPKVVDLAPLRGMRLTSLWLSGVSASDFSPLAGMPLRTVEITATGIKDLNALTNAPISDLVVFQNQELADISAVRTMKLKKAAVNSQRVKDVSALLDCPELESATVQRGVSEIEILRKHLRIKMLGYHTGEMKPAAQFWAEYDAQQAAGKK